MGVSSSVELAPVFEKISQWSWGKVLTVLKDYSDGEYEFGINYSVIVLITGMEMDDAKAIVAAFSKNNSDVVNAITFLSAIICLADVNERQEVRRLETLFSLMDFNKMNQISVDELTILFMCMSTAFYCVVLEPVSDMASDSSLITFTSTLNQKLERKDNFPVAKRDFVDWAMNILMVDMGNGGGGGGSMTIDAIAGHLSVLHMQQQTASQSAGMMSQADGAAAASSKNVGGGKAVDGLVPASALDADSLDDPPN